MNMIGPKTYTRPGLQVSADVRNAFNEKGQKLLDGIVDSMSDEHSAPSSLAMRLRSQMHDLVGMMREATSETSRFTRMKSVADTLAKQIAIEDAAATSQLSGLQVVQAGQVRGAPAASGPIFETTDGRKIKGLRYGESLAPAGTSHAFEEFGCGKLVRALVTGNTAGLPEPMLKTMAAGSATSGGFLIPEGVSPHIIDIARAKARVMEAGAITVPMPVGTLSFAKIVTDPVPGWRGENEQFKVTGPEFGMISLRSRMVAAICKMSLELVTYAANIDQLVTQVLTSAIALEIDRVAIAGSGVGAEPTGIINFGVQEQEVNDLLSDSSEHYSSFSRAYGKLLRANVPPDAVSVLYNSDVATSLDLLVDEQNQPLRPPPSWSKIKSLVTNQIPTDTTTNPDSTYAVMGDFSNVVVGLGSGLVLEVSREASDSTGSAFAEGQVWIRVYAMLDIGVLRPTHFAKISGIHIS